MLMLVIAILLIGAAIAFAKFGTTGDNSLDVSALGGTATIPEIWIPYGLLALCLFLIALWIISKILSIPKAVKRGNAKRDASNSRDALDRGLMEVYSGEFEKGEATLTSHLDGGPGDASKFLAAAKAAETRGASDQADHYLKKASNASNEASAAVRTAQAEMMMSRGEYDKAETLLTNLHHSMPKNGHVMGLLATALQHTGNSGKLSSLTQVMRKSGAASDEQISEIETPTWSKMIATTPTADLGKAWDSLPAEAKTNPGAVSSYAGRLMEVGEGDKAEALVHKAINNSFDEGLAATYGNIESSNVAKQLENAERWAKTNGQSAALASTIGKLSAKREMWSKARDSLVKSAQLDLTPGVCSDLGEVLESMGESAKSKECFKNAALLASGKAPTGLMANLPELAGNLADGVGKKAAAVARRAS